MTTKYKPFVPQPGSRLEEGVPLTQHPDRRQFAVPAVDRVTQHSRIGVRAQLTALALAGAAVLGLYAGTNHQGATEKLPVPGTERAIKGIESGKLTTLSIGQEVQHKDGTAEVLDNPSEMAAFVREQGGVSDANTLEGQLVDEHHANVAANGGDSAIFTPGEAFTVPTMPDFKPPELPGNNEG